MEPIWCGLLIALQFGLSISLAAAMLILGIAVSGRLIDWVLGAVGLLVAALVLAFEVWEDRRRERRGRRPARRRT